MSFATAEPDSPFAPAAPSVWSRADAWIERLGERLNPILVKESRQALKSQQFLVTFSLLLICSLAWSLMGVAWEGPGVYYMPIGASMLIGYHIVLTVPMLLIVPFSAYRSLAAERDDGTYELLSITTLSARQIVTGKLGSAVLQMLIYYSALAPCIAFTYLLRGVDVFTIGVVLCYSFVVSLLLSAFGLTVAAVTRVKQVQLLLSVGLLIGLLIATITWCVSWAEMLHYGGRMQLDKADFWILQLAILSGLCSFILLFIFAAASQLSFASDNRSTRLRILMLAQQTLFAGWMMYFWLAERERYALLSLVMLSGIYWMVMGSLMTGELAPLSPRVKRQLPQSLLGRGFLTWFNPGSGTGYLFAVANLGSTVLLTVVAAAVADLLGFTGGTMRGDFWGFVGLTWAYVTAYLGAGRLIVLWLRRFLHFGLLLPFLVHLVLLIAGAAIPFFLQLWVIGHVNNADYTLLQVTNWIWTLGLAVDGRSLLPTGVFPAVAVFAIVVLKINLILARQEVVATRQATPERVQQDELELHPERALAAQKPASPWDE